MPFPGEKARGRIHTDPAGTGNIDLGPGMQVGEIVFGTGGPVKGFDILFQLNQIAGDKTGGKPEVPENIYQQPGRIPA